MLEPSLVVFEAQDEAGSSKGCEAIVLGRIRMAANSSPMRNWAMAA